MGKRGRPPYPDILTPREWEVLGLIREGLSNEDIAGRLDISVDGAKYHVSQILSKLAVSSREDAAAWDGKRRPWWREALIPISTLAEGARRAGVWLPAAITGASLLIAIAMFSLFVALLWRTQHGSGSEPSPPKETLTAATTSNSDAGAPRVLTSLPEGRLLIESPAPNPTDYRITYEIEGSRVYLLAPAQVSISADKQFIFYAERSADNSAVPNAIIVSRTNSADAVRLAASPPFFGPYWSPEGSDLVFDSGGTIYVRNADSGSQREFVHPEGAHVISWLAHGSQLLLATQGGARGTDRIPYIMDLGTGDVQQITLPPGGIVGPAAEFDSFSPDAKYVGFPTGESQHGWDISIMEIATGRTCLLMAKAPSHQYPQGVGWNEDGRYATYYTKYDPARGFTDQHQVDRATCADSAIAPTPEPPTPTQLAISDDQFRTNAHRISSPSGRYVLAYRFEQNVRGLSPGEAAPTEKRPPTPSPGSLKAYIFDTSTGESTPFIDEQREFAPSAWLP